MTFYVLNEDICPLLSSDILNKLSEIKVNSVNDLLSCDLSKIRSISRNKDIDFQTLWDIKTQLYQTFGPKKWNAFQMLSQDIWRSNGVGFQTGIQKLDKMLVNGIKRGELTELYGYPDSGKTQFCYTFALNFVKKYQKKVLFIDTDLSFSETRVNEILDSKIVDNYVMSFIKVLTILDINSLLKLIESISHDLKTNSKSQYKDFEVVIIDSLSTLLTLEFKKNTFEAEVEEKCGNNFLKVSDLRYRSITLTTQIANTLNMFASDHSMAMIVVNSQSLAMKKNWKNNCKLSLNFFECENKSQESESDKNKSQDIKSENKGYSRKQGKGITIIRTYDKCIESKSQIKFEVTVRGFL